MGDAMRGNFGKKFYARGDFCEKSPLALPFKNFYERVIGKGISFR